LNSELDDHALLEAIAEGHTAAFGQLYDRHADALMAVGLKVLRDREDAEDVIHDVCLEVWERASSYDPDRASVRTWLLVKMRSRCIDRLRRQGRRPSARVDELVGDAEPRHEPQNDLAADRDVIRQALRQLPERLRTVLLLLYFRGMTCTEIADEVAIPVGTVKSRLYAARQKLQDVLGPDRGGAR
jgi:RNA polymerase sigma-70 factor (ECF subfamily)